MWPPAHSVSFTRFMAPNPLLSASTSEPLVNVAVPLNAADPSLAEGMLAFHEANQMRTSIARVQLEDSATELQPLSNQPYSYIEANTELDEEIAALNQSWLERIEMERRETLERRKMERREMSEHREMEHREMEHREMEHREMERRAAMKQLEQMERRSYRLMGGYIMGKVRAFLDFFAWR
jgi:hypothetical protein